MIQIIRTTVVINKRPACSLRAIRVFRVCFFKLFVFSMSLLANIPGKSQDTISEEQQGREAQELFVITNRTLDTTKGSIPFLCTVREENSLSFLHVDCAFDDSLMLTKLDSAIFFRNLSKWSSDWVVFIHGDSKTFEKAVKRAIKMQELYEVRVILFSWSSKDPKIGGGENFRRSHYNVKASMQHFNILLSTLYNWKTNEKSYFEDHNLSLFLHSLGNFYLLCQTHGQNNNVGDHILFNNLIINAAAVQQKHHKVWVERLNMQQDIYIIHNRQDVNLKGARLILRHGKQLGEKPKRPLAENARYISFSHAIGFRFPTHTTHTYFVNSIPSENDAIRSFYDTLLRGETPDLENKERFYQKRQGNAYYFQKHAR
jgi:hypothetical protein